MNAKLATIRLAALFFRKFYQLSPFEQGKWFIWKNIVSIYINKHESPFTVTTKLGQSFKLVLCDYIQQRLFYFGIWEPTLTKYISKNLNPGDIFVDVGANIGYYTCIASKIVGKEGTVHAIEASPSVFMLLSDNISLNKSSNVNPYNLAASDKQGVLNIFMANKSNIGQTTTRVENSEKYNFKKEAEVQADTLDKIIGLDQLLNARIIKIDVEGAEWQVLQGIEHLIPHFSQKTELVIEISPISLLKQSIQPEQIIELFIKNGFSAYTIEDHNEPSNYMQRQLTHKIRPLHEKINGQMDVLFTKNSQLNLHGEYA